MKGGAVEHNIEKEQPRTTTDMCGLNWFDGFRREDDFKVIKKSYLQRTNNERQVISNTRTPFGWFRLVSFMLFNTTYNNISVISWRSVVLVEETRVPGENHRAVTSY